MTLPLAPLVRVTKLSWAPPGGQPVCSDLSFVLPPGLSLVQGGEGRGKTILLALLAGRLAPSRGEVWRAHDECYFADLSDPALDAVPARAWLAAQALQHPRWQAGRQDALAQSLGLSEHLDKSLHMLSAGSRRKVGLLAAALSDAPLVLLDQPHAALDARSCRVVDELLAEAADSRARAWVVADYARPASWTGLSLAAQIDLGD